MSFLIEYWMEFIFGLLISLIGYLLKKTKDYHNTLNFTKTSVILLLKVEIIEKYNEYKKQNCVSIYDRQILSELYEEYKNLGGNGLVNQIINEMENIKISNCIGGD